MLAWYNDLKELTEKKGEARNEFVRRTHARSLSQNSMNKAGSIHSSEGDPMAEDEADKAPFSGEQSVRGQSVSDGAPIGAGVAGVEGGAIGASEMDDTRSEAGWRPPPQRPQPGGRFPSDVNVARGLQAPVSPSSGHSSDRDAIAAAGALPGSGVPFEQTNHQHTDLQQNSGADMMGPHPVAAPQQNYPQAHEIAMPPQEDYSQPQQNYPQAHEIAMPPQEDYPQPQHDYTQGSHPNVVPTTAGVAAPQEAGSQYGEWMAPIAAGAGGAAAGGAFMYSRGSHQQPEGQLIETVDNSKRQMDTASAVPAFGTSSAPIPVVASEPERSLSRPRGLTESTQATGTASQFAPSTVGATTINTNTTAPSEYSDYRPTFEKSNTVTTLADLHMPGEFPKTPGATTPQNGTSYIY